MIESVVALLMFVNGEIREHLVQPKGMAQWMKSNNIEVDWTDINNQERARLKIPQTKRCRLPDQLQKARLRCRENPTVRGKAH